MQTSDVVSPAPQSPQVVALTIDAVKRWVQQCRSEKAGRRNRSWDKPNGRPCVPRPPSVVHRRGEERRTSAGKGSDARNTVETVSSGNDENGTNSGASFYDAIVAEQIRAYLTSTCRQDLSRDGASSISAGSLSDVDAEEGARFQRRLATVSSEELRTLVVETHRELEVALYDALTLESDLMELDEDAAVLERALGHRDEQLDMLTARLVTAEEYNEELQCAKREALRKLSEAKLEIAVLTQRNTRLSQQLEKHEEQLRLRHANDTVEPAHGPCPLRKTANGRVVENSEPSVFILNSASTRTDLCSEEECVVPTAPVAQQRDGQEPHCALVALGGDALGRDRSLKVVKGPLDEPPTTGASNAAAVTIATATASACLVHPLVHRDAPADPASALRRRCETCEHYTASLETEVHRLRAEVLALTTIPSFTTTAGEVDLPPSGEGTATLHRAQELPLAPKEAVGCLVSTGFGRSAETQGAYLQCQLLSAQKNVQRLEKDLQMEREKTQRQSLSEKKLLDNITYLTRQLCSREALDREARLQRRAVKPTAHGEVKVAHTSDRIHSSDSSALRLRSRNRSRMARKTKADAAPKMAKRDTAPLAVSHSASNASAPPMEAVRSRNSSRGRCRQRDSVAAALLAACKTRKERQISLDKIDAVLNSAKRKSSFSGLPPSSSGDTTSTQVGRRATPRSSSKKSAPLSCFRV